MAGAFSSAFSSAFNGGYDSSDGGYEWESTDEIRRRLRRAEEAQEKSRRKRREADQKLADELDRAYRRLVLHEPELAAEVVAALAPGPAEPAIDFRSLVNVIDAAEMVLAIIERDRRNAIEEDDMVVILLAAV